MKLLVLLVLLISLCRAQCSKILFIAPMPAHSHFTLAFRLAKELADRGHEVTCINPYPQETAIKNYRDIPVVELVEYLDEVKKELFQLDTSGPVGITKLIFDIGVGLTQQTFMNKNVQNLLNSEESFDVAIMEHFSTDGLLGIAHHFNVPTILISPTGVSSLTDHFVANLAPSSYIPNVFSTSTKYMNFWERTQNLIFNILINLMREYSFMPQQRELFKKYIKSDVELDDLVYNVSLILESSHVSIHDAVPHVPAAIDIGGYHISPPKKLPESLQSFLDNSEDGVVLFSMGSNLKSKDLKPEVRESILRAFSKIKQNVLWKFEAELDNLPKNVKILKWVPQQDVLAHPSIRVFITHGGLLSTIETVYFGVPIIGIPVFADQKNTIAAAVTKGYALSIPLTELTESRLSWTLQEILNNPKYRENAQKRASLMNDRPLKPIDEAVYWVEHVIRHKGAPQLRSAALDLKWYQREMVDVFAFLLTVLLIICVLLFVTIKKLFWLVYKKNSNVSSKKKNT